MKIFSTGRQVAQTVKNVQRLNVILGTFGRHGFSEILSRMGLERYIPTFNRDSGVENRTMPERLRLALESLGPTFVKLGQIMANRPDMFPQEFIDELKKLQDDVAPAPFEAMKIQIERELGGSIESRFKSFNPAPIAAASIGQVYEAELLTGEHVVVKVQRPDIEKTIKTDISILTFLAELMEKYLPETRIASPVKIVEEFATSLTYELDFMVEANTTSKVAENLKDNTSVVIPRVYRSHTTQRMLTLERLDGIKITDVAKLKASGIDPKKIVDIGARAFFKMLMQDGLFHGDLHGGNLFAMRGPDGEPRVGVIDFGIVGRLGPSSRDALARMVIALITEDYETLCYEYADLGAVGTGVDFDSFQREVRNSVAPYIGLTLKDVNVGPVLISSTRIALKYNIRLPSDWMIVFRAIFSLEGLGRQLDPDFDFLSIGNDLIKVAAKDRFSWERIAKEFAWVARDVGALVQTTPRQIRWMFKKFNSNDFAFEVKFREVEVVRRQLERGYRGMGLSIISAGLFVAAAISLQAQNVPVIYGYPMPSVVCFALGGIGFLGLVFRSWK